MVCGTGAIGRWGWLDRPLWLVDFRPACQTHDNNYNFPVQMTRAGSDRAFLNAMLRLCRKAARWYKPYLLLAPFAHLYYRVVRGSRGQVAWDKARRNDK